MADIQKLFSFNQGRNIWRILLTDLNQIVIEERDIVNKQVYFSCINRETGEFFWRDKTFLDEKFWIGIEGTRSEFLILHQFEKPDMPNHKKIINVDLNTGEVLWANDDLTFYDMDNENIYAFNSTFEGREFFQLDIRSGEMINQIGDEEKSKVVLENIPEKDYSRYSFTELIGGAKSNEAQKEIITKIIGDNFYLDLCEFIERDNFFIFNYYDKIDPRSLTNRIVIFDKESEKPILIETLNSSTPAPVPDSFFMYDNDLYFIKDKTELIAYRLIH
jgi:hypothetical protein